MTGDYYVLSIPEAADAPICICIAAIMDYWLYNRKKQTDIDLDATPDFS